MIVSVFIATSLDGYIARRNGELDWLPPAPAEGDAFGYHAFMRDVDAIIMGRNTYETVLGFGGWPYECRVIVLSTRDIDVPAHLSQRVEVLNAPAEEITKRLSCQGCRKLYVDGGKTIQGFIKAGLVDELILTRIPVLLGEGLPLFGSLNEDVRLEHLETRTYENGMVQSHYRIPREHS